MCHRYLTEAMTEDPFLAKHKRLTEALTDLIERYGLVRRECNLGNRIEQH